MVPKEKEAAIEVVHDRGEVVAAMEPLRLAESSSERAALTDLALDLVAHSAAFANRLPPGVRASLADLVRSMNCYYSNLIEGHDTHPIDIERALDGDYSSEPAKRQLQLEARAHIEVQRWIDGGALAGRETTAAALADIHRRFGERLPPELLWVQNPETGERVPVIPGALRTRDVRVGQHRVISPGAVPRFLARIEAVYTPLAKPELLLASGAAHHRFLWIHPFLDGNGRVARLMSHALLARVLETGGIWSIARGLARRVVDYKMHLARCDEARRNDLDGRGALSEAALTDFTRFFLQICLDQVDFMAALVEPERLHARLRLWAEEEIQLDRLPAQTPQILDALLYRGALPRGDIPALLGVGERQARRIVRQLLTVRVVSSASPRAAITLAFPATLASRWLPGLFPDARG